MARPHAASSAADDLVLIVAEAAAAWGDPELATTVDISFSKRLRTSAGRAFPTRGIVTLHAALADGAPELLREVVIHELAHVVAWRRYGRRSPHGAEWRRLVREAGGIPRVRLPAGTLPVQHREGGVWLHSCPICQAARHARRPVRNWRCHRCIEAGRSGELKIERVRPVTVGNRREATIPTE